MMNNTDMSMITIVVGFLIVFLYCNTYALSNKAENPGFASLENDRITSSPRNIFRKRISLINNSDNAFDRQIEEIFRQDEEIFTPTRETSNRKGYLRATIDTSVVLGLTALYYWSTQTYSSDFDYDVSFDTLRKKFSGEAIRFDDNTFNTNSFPGHSLAGAYYYLIARNNNLSRLESFLWGLATSTIFEFFIELPEVASINDIVTTPLAGATIGESMYEFSRYFRCSKNKNTLPNKILAAIIDPIALVNSLVWRDVRYNLSDAECPYNTIQNEFNIFTGMSVVYHENTERFNPGFVLGFYGKLYLIPRYGKASDLTEFINNTVLTEMALEAVVTDTSVDSFRFVAKTVWAAYHRQKIARGPEGDATGYSFFVGLASAFEQTQYRTGEFDDWIGAVHVLGPAMELTLFHKDGYSRLGLDTFGDFAMVRSFAFDKYKKNHSLNGIKSVLQEENYYYAFGVTVHPKIEVRYGLYRLLVYYKYAHYDSIEGLDRIKTLNDFHLADEQQEYGLALSRRVDFFASSFSKMHEMRVEAEVRRIARSGFIADDKIAHDGGNTWLLLRFKMAF
jgi:Domain of unknown function (DUF3943)